MEDAGIGPLGGVAAGILLTVGAGLLSNSLFPGAFQELMGVEGGYVDHVDDRGGVTNFGVTLPTAQACGIAETPEDMYHITAEDAAQCAYTLFWEPLLLDEIANIQDSTYAQLAEQLFATGYHVGPGTAIRWFQSCLNSFNQRERLYPDIVVDGRMGPASLSAFLKFRSIRGADGDLGLRNCMDAHYGAHMLYLIQRDPTQESFAYGWFLKRF